MIFEVKLTRAAFSADEFDSAGRRHVLFGEQRDNYFVSSHVQDIRAFIIPQLAECREISVFRDGILWWKGIRLNSYSPVITWVSASSTELPF